MNAVEQDLEEKCAACTAIAGAVIMQQMLQLEGLSSKRSDNRLPHICRSGSHAADLSDEVKKSHISST